MIMTDDEVFDGYDILFDANTRLAHEALLRWAAENEPDRWPTPASVYRFARFYSVDLGTLAGLVGILVFKHGHSYGYCDSRRGPETVNKLGPGRFSSRALASYGFYVNATRVIERRGRERA